MQSKLKGRLNADSKESRVKVLFQYFAKQVKNKFYKLPATRISHKNLIF